MSDAPEFKESVYSTVCPGCNFGCGVYMRALTAKSVDAILSIDFKKPSPVNEGKLCRFGVNLASFYTPAISKANGKTAGKAADNKAAIEKAAEVLKKTDASKVCFLSVGNTTNEEHLAFMNAAKALDLPVNTGMTGLFKDIGKLHAYTGRGTTYDDVENAKKIYIFVDPYVQYPLMVRRLVHAKSKGAEILTFGVKEFPISTKHVFLKPTESLYDVKEFAPDADSVVISDLTPYTQAKRLAEMIEIAGENVKMLFLKPFANSTGAGYLSKHTKQKSFDDILDGIESGDIKVLVCLDSDLIDICLDENIAETLKNLDCLIVFASRQTSVCEAADIVIATEPFYKKKGSVMNAEGRLLQTTAAAGDLPLTGFNALSDLAAALGGSSLDFDAVHTEAVTELGATEDEFKILPPVLKKEKPPIEKISDTLPMFDLEDHTAAPEESAADLSEEEKEKALHVYVTNPFLWNNVVDDDDFIEICRCTVTSSKLIKGYTAGVTCHCGEATKTTRFKVSPMMCRCLLSTRKQPFSKAIVTEVTVKRTPTKPNEPEIVKECSLN
ncbi:MAG: molybdopterin-dependent oxidoreductase [Methanimicrococcus sp.]|nr:molybdopterin-dependent oxidoreductase [Methanimicrococcus sp.]